MLRRLMFVFILGYSGIIQAETIDRIVAIVNEDIVTLSDVSKFTDRLNSGAFTDEFLVPDEQTRKALLGDKEKLLSKLIDEKIIDSEVKRQNLTVPFERVEQEIRSIAKRNNISRDELKQALKDKGLPFSQYQDFIKTGLERQQLIEKSITSKIKISEDDVTAQMSASSESENYEFTLAQILFLPAKGGVAAAKNRADFVLKKLKDGGVFEKLATEYSEDPNFAAGGVLGTFRSGEFIKELEDSVKSLSAGDHTGIIQSKAGIHILKVLKKKTAADPKLEKEKDLVRNQLFEKAYKKQFNSWLEQLRQDAFVRINR